ncbi:hypothetical protein GWI33_011016 [Rhynchophorus ferrugineus]|nr:hypothetical protein GWI33_011016 [Rhynchophorus ferrugineus]
MRDYFSHTELILAGMWGGTRGAIHHIETLITDYIQTGNYLAKRVMDQHFLRYCIYPIIKQSMLHHDSLFEIQGSQPFPEHPIRDNYEQYNHYHVGCNISAHMEITVDVPNEQTVIWSVKDEHGHTVCEYQAQVFDKKCSVDLPRPFAEKIIAKKWKVITQTD